MNHRLATLSHPVAISSNASLMESPRRAIDSIGARSPCHRQAVALAEPTANRGALFMSPGGAVTFDNGASPMVHHAKAKMPPAARARRGKNKPIIRVLHVSIGYRIQYQHRHEYGRHRQPEDLSSARALQLVSG
jgi:hypothetical protein